MMEYVWMYKKNAELFVMPFPVRYLNHRELRSIYTEYEDLGEL